MMKNSLLLLLMSTLFIFSSGCKKSGKSELPLPVADFSFTGANVPAPATVLFTNLSSNSTSYLWDFGDNTISFEKDPAHFYQTGAAYSVKLTANSGLGTNSVTKNS